MVAARNEWSGASNFWRGEEDAGEDGTRLGSVAEAAIAVAFASRTGSDRLCPAGGVEEASVLRNQ